MLCCTRDRSRIVLIDYGISRPYICDITNLHIPEHNDPRRRPIGTTLFASIRAQSGLSLSRRDDIMSLIYTIIYLANGRLPWSARASPDAILRMKQSIPTGALCRGLPSGFEDFVKHATGLQFTECPDYELLQRAFA